MVVAAVEPADPRKARHRAIVTQCLPWRMRAAAEVVVQQGHQTITKRAHQVTHRALS